MQNAGLAEKPRRGQKNGIRHRRRRKRLLSPSGVGQKWPPLRRSASGPHVDYNARLYDPKIGRFLSTDPLIAHPGSTQSINPYSYVENNPLNKTDPTGMASTCAGGGAGQTCKLGQVDKSKVESIDVNSDRSLTLHMKDGSTMTSAAGSVSKTQVAKIAGAQMKKLGPSAVNMKSLAKALGVTRTKNHSPKTATTHMVDPKNTNTQSSAPTSDSKNYQLYLVALSADGDWPTGHAFIGGITPNGKIEAEGFYASNKHWVGALLGQDVPGNSKSDYARFIKALKGNENFAMLRADVDKKTYERVMYEMSHYADSHQYNLYNDNCVTAAETIWYKNGLSPKNFGDNTPTRMYYRIKGMPATGSLSPIYRQ